MNERVGIWYLNTWELDGTHTLLLQPLPNVIRMESASSGCAWMVFLPKLAVLALLARQIHPLGAHGHRKAVSPDLCRPSHQTYSPTQTHRSSTDDSGHREDTYYPRDQSQQRRGGAC
eukprot:1372931-Amorphochlora_amoeboformis.AAC.1